MRKRIRTSYIIIILALAAFFFINSMASPEPVEYSVSASIVGEGEVLHTGTYKQDESVVLEAVSHFGYRFAYWLVGEDYMGEEPSLPITLRGDIEVTAVFEPADYVVKITVHGQGKVLRNWDAATVRLQAVPDKGYEFFGWIEDSQELDESAEYAFEFSGERELLARFRPILKAVDGNNFLAVVGKQSTLGQFEPDDLVRLPKELSVNAQRVVRQIILDDLLRMAEAAKQDGVALKVVSGYRSYSTQQRLFRDYSARDGVLAAERFSARPGQSEHQLGTAVDFGGTAFDFSSEFARTNQGRWLQENAYKYGFAISYPEYSEEITGYIYEPWHYRYIGVELAREWKDSGLALIEFLRKQ